MMKKKCISLKVVYSPHIQLKKKNLIESLQKMIFPCFSWKPSSVFIFMLCRPRPSFSVPNLKKIRIQKFHPFSLYIDEVFDDDEDKKKIQM